MFHTIYKCLPAVYFLGLQGCRLCPGSQYRRV